METLAFGLRSRSRIPDSSAARTATVLATCVSGKQLSLLNLSQALEKVKAQKVCYRNKGIERQHCLPGDHSLFALVGLKGGLGRRDPPAPSPGSLTTPCLPTHSTIITLSQAANSHICLF